jgi:hypothetical protein
MRPPSRTRSQSRQRRMVHLWSPAMVRRGSTVRVRQRALQKPRKNKVFLSGCLARDPLCSRYGAVHGAPRIPNGVLRYRVRLHGGRRWPEQRSREKPSCSCPLPERADAEVTTASACGRQFADEDSLASERACDGLLSTVVPILALLCGAVGLFHGSVSIWLAIVLGRATLSARVVRYAHVTHLSRAGTPRGSS